MFVGLICTPSLQFGGNSHQVINDYKNTRVLFNFKTLKGVAVFPQSWILSLFFRMDRTFDPVKSQTLCERCTLVFSHLMTISFVANDKLFLCSCTDPFLCMYRICSRNLGTFFSILAAEKSGCVKYPDFFLWRYWSGFYSSIIEDTVRFVNILL